jgi:hypothetical protein
MMRLIYSWIITWLWPAVEISGVVSRPGSNIIQRVGSQMAVKISALRAYCALLQRKVLVLISVRDIFKPRVQMLLEVLGEVEKSNDLIDNRILDLPALTPNNYNS